MLTSRKCDDKDDENDNDDHWQDDWWNKYILSKIRKSADNTKIFHGKDTANCFTVSGIAVLHAESDEVVGEIRTSSSL